MIRLAAGAALALLLAACGGLPQVQPASPAVPQMRAQADRLIVLTVANPAQETVPHAGSTPSAYDAMPAYAAGDAARATVASIARDYGLREVAAWPIAPLHMHCVVLEVPAAQSRETVLARLAADRRVQLAQPLQTFDTLGASYNDPYLGLQRGFAGIDAGDAQQWTRGEGVRVAVVDTGVDVAHPDLKGRIGLQRNFVDADAQRFAQDRHGTEVAGIIAADANNAEGIVGVAPAAQLLLFKACWQVQAQGDAAQCNSFTLAQALTAAIQSGAHIINLSLGGPPDPLLGQLLDYALRHDVIVVGAVPPDGRLDGFPLGVPGVIAVDAAERSAAAAGVLRAPGREILTLVPGGHYDFASGSSLAAAHVSGTLALLLAQDAGLDGRRAYALLRRTSGATSHASVNACAAMVAMRAQGSCAPVPEAAPLDAAARASTLR